MSASRFTVTRTASAVTLPLRWHGLRGQRRDIHGWLLCRDRGTTVPAYSARALRSSHSEASTFTQFSLDPATALLVAQPAAEVAPPSAERPITEGVTASTLGDWPPAAPNPRSPRRPRGIHRSGRPNYPAFRREAHPPDHRCSHARHSRAQKRRGVPGRPGDSRPGGSGTRFLARCCRVGEGGRNRGRSVTRFPSRLTSGCRRPRLAVLAAAPDPERSATDMTRRH